MKTVKFFRSIRMLKVIALDGTTFVILFVMLVPFIWLLLTSFKRPIDFLSWPPVIVPDAWTFSNYKMMIAEPMILNNFANSMIIAVVSTFLAVLIGSAGAYSLLRIKLPYKLNNIILTWILITRMYPAIATAIPYFMLIQKLGLLDTRLSLIITYTSFNLPFVVWLMLGFFQGIPKSIEDAAIVDGCNFFQRFVRIIFPLSAPGIIATTILSFLLAWNEFLFAVILTSVKAKTIPVVIAGFITDKGLEWGEMSALGVTFVLPVIVLAWISQKYLVRGLTLGAVKG